MAKSWNTATVKMYVLVLQIYFILVNVVEAHICKCDYDRNAIICSKLRLTNFHENHASCGQFVWKIDLSENDIRKFPSDLQQFRVVDLSRNVLQNLDATSVQKVKELNVSQNSLSDINLRNIFLSLRQLNASKNNLGSLNGQLLQGQCNLALLDISENKIGSLQSIERCQGLRVLLAARNLISKVTDDLVMLTRLMTLDLSRNRIHKVANLPTSLEMLDLSFNQLVWISDSMLSGLRSLKVLNLDTNLIDLKIGGAFSDLTSLMILKINENRITFLHEDMFDGLASLKVLELRYNSIMYVSDGTFSDLQALEELYLDWNLLTTLPALRLGRMVRRVSLDLNYIQQLNLSALLTLLPEDAGKRDVFFLVNSIRGCDPEWPKIMQHFNWECMSGWLPHAKRLLLNAVEKSPDRTYTLARAECPCVRFFKDDRGFGTCISAVGEISGIPWLHAAGLIAILYPDFEGTGHHVVFDREEL